jgi:hypothetical protein
VGRVHEHVRERDKVQRTARPGGHLAVQAGSDPRPPDFADPGIDTELGHQAVDLAGGDTVHVPLRHHQRAAREITAFADFPETRWRKVWSTSPPVRQSG